MLLNDGEMQERQEPEVVAGRELYDNVFGPVINKLKMLCEEHGVDFFTMLKLSPQVYVGVGKDVDKNNFDVKMRSIRYAAETENTHLINQLMLEGLTRQYGQETINEAMAETLLEMLDDRDDS